MKRWRSDDSVINEPGHPPNQTSAGAMIVLFEAERQTEDRGDTPPAATVRVRGPPLYLPDGGSRPHQR
jgi:hypothetical protein